MKLYAHCQICRQEQVKSCIRSTYPPRFADRQHMTRETSSALARLCNLFATRNICPSQNPDCLQTLQYFFNQKHAPGKCLSLRLPVGPLRQHQFAKQLNRCQKSASAQAATANWSLWKSTLKSSWLKWKVLGQRNRQYKFQKGANGERQTDRNWSRTMRVRQKIAQLRRLGKRKKRKYQS